MALSADRVARWHRAVAEPAPDHGDIRFTGADQDSAATDLLAQFGDCPIRVFAYGTPIWKPGADLAETHACFRVVAQTRSVP